MENRIDVDIVVLDEACEPKYAQAGDSGFDCFSASVEDIIIMPSTMRKIPLGFKIAVPAGFEMQVRPKSGLAFNNQLTIQNTPGTVDSGYRNEVAALVRNEGRESYIVQHGKKICQGVIAPVMRAEFHKQGSLDETDRGLGGFGSTGI